MALEQFPEHHHRVVVDKYVDPRNTVLIRTFDYVIRPSADGDSGPIHLILPVVSEAVGRFYSIIARNADAVNTISIHDRGDSECWPAPIVLDGKCDRILLYSDGLAWHPLGIGALGGWPGFATTNPPGTTGVPTSPVTEQAEPEGEPEGEPQT